MHHSLERPPGTLHRLAVVVVCSLLFLGSAVHVGAAPPDGLDHGSWPTSTESDDKSNPAQPAEPPPSFGFDARDLTGEKDAPYASDADTMAKWKTFQPSPPPTQEGVVVYYNPAARSASPTAKTAPQEPAGQKWLLPGGIMLAIAVLFGGSLAAWRILALQRAKLVAERASRYVPQSRRG